MKSVFIWCIRTLIAFAIITGISYHNDLDNDGELRFGFPKEIYSKLARVMFVDTKEIGGAEYFHPWHLVADIAFAFVIVFVLFYVRNLLRKIKNKKSAVFKS